jgi:hypothetical protein
MRSATAGSVDECVQGVDEHPQPPEVDPVEAERDPR